MNHRELLLVAVATSCAFSACGGDSKDPGNAAPQAGRGGSTTGNGNGAGAGGDEAGAGELNAGAGGEDAGTGAVSGGGGAESSGGSGEPGAGGNAGDGTAGAIGEGGGANPPTDTCVYPAASELGGASVPAGYCAYTWASGLLHPRGIIVDEKGDVLVSDNGRIVLLYDDNGNGVSEDDERVVLRTEAGLNHGIALNAGYLYASTPTTVYRWPYEGDREPLGTPQAVVTGMPTGGHVTRTPLFDNQGRLYVSIGSSGNVDTDSRRARLIRFPANVLAETSTFAEGELFADGLRNEAGLALDSQGRVWGVENGRDNLQRADLGADIHQDNPGEELNLFREEDAGRFYGYPYCWSEYNLPNGNGPGTQWADPTNTKHDDAWCKDTANVIPPVMVMQGHSAPLDIKFYVGSGLPADVVGDAFVTFHGSWNRTTKTGYKVVRIPFGNDGMPSGDPVPVLESANPGDSDPQWPHRPVGLAIGHQGQLFVTSDASGVIIAVGYAAK
ncbi:MAG: hypothetical protein EOO73_11755 [Myxococcales bacterium]|nr:MAG: hypothetical protein EOO73_11755 [Myxococcales bacterium]